MISPVAKDVGNKALEVIEFFGAAARLLKLIFQELMKRPHYPRLLAEQVHQVGNRSLSLVLAAALSTGMVMALQFGLGLEKFGGKLYVPKIVALSIVRELGPIFTSLMVAGRVGAGIASEIGSMMVTQQIDAIRALGTSPIKRVVIPRVLGTVIALPILTTFANTVGVLGAIFVCGLELGLDPAFSYTKVTVTITYTDYLVGILKTIFFAVMISVSACYFGLNVREGTKGVGIATTKAVVVGSIMIVVSDFFLTKLFWVIFEKWN